MTNIVNCKHIENPKYVEWKIKYSNDDKTNTKSYKGISLGGRVHDNDSKRYKCVNAAAYMVA